jgi:hypothetical protein
MTREALVSLPPERVLELARGFFTGSASGYAGTLVGEGGGELTRVRCSTLRYHPSIGQFLLQLETESAATGA